MDALKNTFADIWLLMLARNASIYFPFVFLCFFSHVIISVALKHFSSSHYLRDTLKGDDVVNTIGRLGLAYPL